MNRGTAGVFEEYGSVIASVVGMAVAMAAILTLEDRPGLGFFVVSILGSYFVGKSVSDLQRRRHQRK